MARLDRLLARIDEVLEGDTFSSARAWCESAGLSPSYIAALRSRGGAHGTGEVKDVKHEAIVALARAAGRDVSWMMGDTIPCRDGKPEGLEEAIQAVDWPAGLTAPQAAETLRVAREEAQKNEVSLPLKFWLQRLAEIAHAVRDDSTTSSNVRISRRVPRKAGKH